MKIREVEFTGAHDSGWKLLAFCEPGDPWRMRLSISRFTPRPYRGGRPSQGVEISEYLGVVVDQLSREQVAEVADVEIQEARVLAAYIDAGCPFPGAKVAMELDGVRDALKAQVVS